MLREKKYIFLRVNFIIDFIISVLAFLASHLLRNHILSQYVAPNFFLPSVFSDYLILFIIFPILSLLFLYRNKCYEIQNILNQSESVKRVIWSAIQVFLVLITGIYFIQKDDPVSRGQILLTPFLQILFLLIKNNILRKTLLNKSKDKENLEKVIIIGSGENLEHGIDLISSHPVWKFNIVGIISDNEESVKKDQKIKGISVIGNINDTLNYVEQNNINQVIVIPSAMALTEYKGVFEGCELMGIRIHLILDFYKYTIAQPALNILNYNTMITYSPVKEMGFELFIKYLADRIAAFFLLIILLPVIIAVMIIIKISSKKNESIFFIQKRCGLNGKIFNLYKFRTMKMNAESEVEKLKRLNEADGPVFKIKDDPRITKVGKILRKFSLDELPQFFNVLKGDMSLVGPRPPIPSEVEKYDRWQRRRLSMKPGITCLWQVMGRNKLDFNTWMKLDLQYIDNWSLWLDFKIIVRTVFVVIIGYGAM